MLVALLLTPMAPVRLQPAHPIFVSVTEIEYNAEDKALEISCKVFTDDFEKALAKANARPVDLYHPKDSSLLEQQIAAYMRKRLQIRVDGRPLSLQFVGYELEEQSTFSYFLAAGVVSAPRKVEVGNTILFEMYDSQMSIIHVTVSHNRKSTKLDYPAAEAVFTW